MTKSLKIDYPSIADIVALNGRFVLGNIGIDSIKLIAKYDVFKKMAEKIGLTIEPMPKNNKYWKKINDEVNLDTKKRLTVNKFSPIVEVIKLPKVNPKDKDLYISIVRNIPTLFNLATHHKRAKDSHCLIVFAGLHQPSKKINSDAIKIISKFLKRKAFKCHSLDVAIDTDESKPINKEHKKEFTSQLMPFSKHGVNLEKTSYYINKLDPTEGSNMSKIIFYDKYRKQLNQQKKEIITEDLKQWKRLEVTLTFDVTDKSNKGFKSYIESMEFVDDLYEVHAVAQKAKIKNYQDDYITYQLNSFLDNRFMNNKESKSQFNSVESLERFKQSDFRRYVLPI